MVQLGQQWKARQFVKASFFKGTQYQRRRAALELQHTLPLPFIGIALLEVEGKDAMFVTKSSLLLSHISAPSSFPALMTLFNLRTAQLY